MSIFYEGWIKTETQITSSLLLLFSFKKVSSYREAIEILQAAVQKADIDEVIDILKRYKNEEVHSSIFLRSSDFFLEKHIFFFYRKCNMNVFCRMSWQFISNGSRNIGG